jgi:hypothetical protein
MRIRSLDGLRGSGIATLAREGVDGLADVRALRDMPRPVHLRVTSSSAHMTKATSRTITSADLGNLPRVRILEWPTHEGSLAFLAGWTGLRDLRLLDAGKLTDLETLETLPALEKVYVRGPAAKRDERRGSLQDKLDLVRTPS